MKLKMFYEFFLKFLYYFFFSLKCTAFSPLKKWHNNNNNVFLIFFFYSNPKHEYIYIQFISF